MRCFSAVLTATSILLISLFSKREAIDALIGDIFNTVTAANNASTQHTNETPAKRKRSPTPDLPLPPSQIPISSRNHSSNNTVKKEKDAITDAELARQLSAELNPTRSTRGSGSAKPKASRGAGGAAKKRKSAAKIHDSDDSGPDDDDDEEEEDAAPKKKRAKKAKDGGGGGGGAKGGLTAEYILSDALGEVVQTKSLSRPQVVKQLWVYIKANNLQNPNNRREILCDEKVSVLARFDHSSGLIRGLRKLRAVFQTDKIDMFKMNKDLGA